MATEGKHEHDWSPRAVFVEDEENIAYLYEVCSDCDESRLISGEPVEVLNA